MISASAFVLSISAAQVDGKQGQLSTQEQKVIDYLVKDWGEDYSVTTVDIAMKSVKADQSDETRFRIGSYIKTHPELHEVIRRWGWVTLVLTPDEKLIARALINSQRVRLRRFFQEYLDDRKENFSKQQIIELLQT